MQEGAYIKFEWLRGQVIPAKVLQVSCVGDACRVELLEDAAFGVKRKGDDMWVHESQVRQ